MNIDELKKTNLVVNLMNSLQGYRIIYNDTKLDSARKCRDKILKVLFKEKQRQKREGII